MAAPVLFGTLLRSLRLTKNITLNDLAITAGIDKGLMSKIESNNRRATKEQLDKFIEILGANTRVLTISWIASKILYEIEGLEYRHEAIKAAGEILMETNNQLDSGDDITNELDKLKKRLDTAGSIPRQNREFILNTIKSFDLLISQEDGNIKNNKG